MEYFWPEAERNESKSKGKAALKLEPQSSSTFKQIDRSIDRSINETSANERAGEEDVEKRGTRSLESAAARGVHFRHLRVTQRRENEGDRH